jgi:hypothetical protein
MIELCPICKSAKVEVRGPYHGTHPIFTGLKRAHCCSCGMVFAVPMPAEKILGQYNSSYFASAHGSHPRDPFSIAFFSGIARLRLSYIERYLGKHNCNVSVLMEVGPGHGFFARNFLEKYPDTTYRAIETDTSCYTSLKDVGVHLVDVSSKMEKIMPVDLVVMSHVLEHVANPRGFISDVTQNLREGGILFIEVPCRDWEYKPINEPHLLFFDKGPMQHLLRQMGFEDIQVSYHGQEIERLRSVSVLRSKLMALRSRLITLGVVAPFARIRPGMEALTDPLERAAVAPFKAHCEMHKPSWWLRAIAHKS